MKYFLYLLLFLVTFVSAAQKAKQQALPTHFTSQVRGGYFYPQSETLRNTYKNGGGEFELEGTLRLTRGLSLWGNFNFFQRQGHTFGESSNIHLFPLSAGLKYNFWLFQNVALYLGIGANYTLIRIHEETFWSRDKYHNDNWGFVTKSGFLFNLNDNSFIDIFTDYYFTNAHILDAKHNVGGLRVGAGLGIVY